MSGAASKRGVYENGGGGIFGFFCLVVAGEDFVTSTDDSHRAPPRLGRGTEKAGGGGSADEG